MILISIPIVLHRFELEYAVRKMTPDRYPYHLKPVFPIDKIVQFIFTQRKVWLTIRIEPRMWHDNLTIGSMFHYYLLLSTDYNQCLHKKLVSPLIIMQTFLETEGSVLSFSPLKNDYQYFLCFRMDVFPSLGSKQFKFDSTLLKIYLDLLSQRIERWDEFYIKPIYKPPYLPRNPWHLVL